jgi:phenylalanyl-tRNA synthetase beta subunit
VKGELEECAGDLRRGVGNIRADDATGLPERHGGRDGRRQPIASRSGTSAQLDPSAMPMAKIPFKLVRFELELESMLAQHGRGGQLQAARPACRRSYATLAFVAKIAVNYIDIETTIRAAAGPTLESMRLVDIYQGKAGASRITAASRCAWSSATRSAR